MKAIIIDAIRTPVGRAHAEKGIYRDVRADDLSADLMKSLLERTGIPGSEVEDIHWGCVKQQGEQGNNLGRMAALIAGMPVTVASATVNRLCGSSLQALNQAGDFLTHPAVEVAAAPVSADFDQRLAFQRRADRR